MDRTWICCQTIASPGTIYCLFDSAESASYPHDLVGFSLMAWSQRHQRHQRHSWCFFLECWSCHGKTLEVFRTSSHSLPLTRHTAPRANVPSEKSPSRLYVLVFRYPSRSKPTPGMNVKSQISIARVNFDPHTKVWSTD